MALEDFDAQEWVHDSPYGHLHLRDLFAAFALVGFIESDFVRTVSRPDAASADCYRLADAMLAQRVQSKEQV